MDNRDGRDSESRTSSQYKRSFVSSGTMGSSSSLTLHTEEIGCKSTNSSTNKTIINNITCSGFQLLYPQNYPSQVPNGPIDGLCGSINTKPTSTTSSSTTGSIMQDGFASTETFPSNINEPQACCPGTSCQRFINPYQPNQNGRELEQGPTFKLQNSPFASENYKSGSRVMTINSDSNSKGAVFSSPVVSIQNTSPINADSFSIQDLSRIEASGISHSGNQTEGEQTSTTTRQQLILSQSEKPKKLKKEEQLVGMLENMQDENLFLQEYINHMEIKIYIFREKLLEMGFSSRDLNNFVEAELSKNS